MAVLRRLAAVYMVAVAVVVAVYFIINPFLAETDFDVLGVWYVLDVLMVIGLAIALAFNYERKREQERDPDGSSTRAYLDVNIAFYATAAVTVLFLHNWFSLLAGGEESLDGNHQAWIIWAFVDVALPLVLGATGCQLWRDADRA